MLKIPAAGDRPPPLVVPLRNPLGPESGAAVSLSDSRRKKRKSKRGDGHSWDQSAGSSNRSRRHERKQMGAWLIGGSILFVSIVVAVLAAMSGKSNQGAPVAEKPAATPPAVKFAGSIRDLSDFEFVAQAEPIARRFLEASSIDEMLPLVRNPLVAGPRMKALFPDGKIKPAGLGKFNSDEEIIREGSHCVVKLRTRDFKERAMNFFLDPGGMRVDWESWAAWSEMPWPEFLTKMPTEAKEFRINIAKLDYYNRSFADDTKWQSYRLTVPDRDTSVYGYVERGSALDRRLDLPSDAKRTELTLKLRYPEGSRSANQLLIDSVVSDSWVIDTPNSP